MSEKAIDDVLSDMGYTVEDAIIDSGQFVSSTGYDEDEALKSPHEVYKEAREEMSVSSLVKNSEKSGQDKNNFVEHITTSIDKKVEALPRQELPDVVRNTFKDGIYRTVKTTENLILYRTYGEGAKKEGCYLTTMKPTDRLETKIESALPQHWKNSRQYYCEVKVPKGTILNIGKVGEQITSDGHRLAGGADQILVSQEFAKNSDYYLAEHELGFSGAYSEFAAKAKAIESET